MALRRPQLHQPEPVGQAMGNQALALLATLNTIGDNVDRLSEHTATAFTEHPDYAIIISFPGLAS